MCREVAAIHAAASFDNRCCFIIFIPWCVDVSFTAALRWFLEVFAIHVHFAGLCIHNLLAFLAICGLIQISPHHPQSNTSCICPQMNPQSIHCFRMFSLCLNICLKSCQALGFVCSALGSSCWRIKLCFQQESVVNNCSRDLYRSLNEWSTSRGILDVIATQWWQDHSDSSIQADAFWFQCHGICKVLKALLHAGCWVALPAQLCEIHWIAQTRNTLANMDKYGVYLL